MADIMTEETADDLNMINQLKVKTGKCYNCSAKRQFAKECQMEIRAGGFCGIQKYIYLRVRNFKADKKAIEIQRHEIEEKV